MQQGGADVAVFAYDGFGRRVTKTAAGVTHTYLYDGEDIVEERLSTGDVIRYVHGPGIDHVLARTMNGANAVYYVTDHLGSVVQEVDATQAVTLNREYDPWGVPVQGAAVSGYAFTGREWDAETSLYYYRARYYQPETGSFLSDDPVFQLGSQQAYVWGRPLTYADPTGRIGFFAVLAPLVGPAVAAIGDALVYTGATLAGVAIAEAISHALMSEDADDVPVMGEPVPGTGGRKLSNREVKKWEEKTGENAEKFKEELTGRKAGNSDLFVNDRGWIEIRFKDSKGAGASAATAYAVRSAFSTSAIAIIMVIGSTGDSWNPAR